MKIETLGNTIVFGFIAFMGIGWVMNLIAVFNSNFDPITGQVVLRTIGIFLAPLGGVMGWF